LEGKKSNYSSDVDNIKPPSSNILASIAQEKILSDLVQTSFRQPEINKEVELLTKQCRYPCMDNDDHCETLCAKLNFIFCNKRKATPANPKMTSPHTNTFIYSSLVAEVGSARG
jgi:hypothetical protein